MTNDTSPASERFGRILYWKVFRASAEHIFKSDDSLRWFIRQHEGALVRAGALLKLPKGNFVDPVVFREVAIDLMSGGDPEASSGIYGCGA